ncbi:MAG: ABC transporter permease [Deltaproteobacteria bacterium]|nr:ABC transporter permease [Deltaproteobacteria bacterium]
MPPALQRGSSLGARLLVDLLALVAFSFVLFALLNSVAGRPEELLVTSDPSIREADLVRFVDEGGRDRSIAHRYICWWIGRSDHGERCAYWPSHGLLSGDLGWSKVHQRPVVELLRSRLVATLSITLPAFALGLLVALGLGLEAMARRKGVVAMAASALPVVVGGVPVHWLCLTALLVFALWAEVLPSGGSGGLSHLVLPVLVLTAIHAGRWVRHVRHSVGMVLESELALAMRARGIEERVVRRRALLNAIAPLLVIVSASVPSMFGGAVVVERVFSLPGMGMLIFESIRNDDRAVATVVLCLYACITLVAMGGLDILVRSLDPRSTKEELA